MSKPQIISLKLSPELLQQAEQIVGNTDDLQDFFVAAIAKEIERRKLSTQNNFWQGVDRIREEMQQAEIEIDTEEIWGNVRDREIGRDVVLS